MRVGAFAEITDIATGGGALALASAAGPARWSEAGGWEDLRAIAGAGPHRAIVTPGALWIAGATRAVRLAPGGAAAAFDGATFVAEDAERWAVLGPGGGRCDRHDGSAPLALPAPPGETAALALHAGWLVAAGSAGLHALDPAATPPAWRALPCTPPVRELAAHDGLLFYVDRSGARALGAGLAPHPDARDWFRLDGGRLFSGPGGLVGLRDRLFELAGTPRLRNWTPLADPGGAIRDYLSAAQIRALAPGAAGTYMGLASGGLWLLPAGESRWERLPLPGLPASDAAATVRVALDGTRLFVACGAGLWQARDTAGAPPILRPFARALLVFPQGPDPELAESMVYPDGSGALAAGALFANDALWYAARAMPGLQAGVLRRADPTSDAPAWPGEPAPLAANLLLDAEERAWVLQTDRAVELETFLAMPPSPEERRTAARAAAAAARAAAAGPDDDEDEADAADDAAADPADAAAAADPADAAGAAGGADAAGAANAEHPDDPADPGAAGAPAPPAAPAADAASPAASLAPPGAAPSRPTLIKVAARANTAAVAGVFAPAGASPAAPPGMHVRPITALAFTREGAAIVATAGGLDLTRATANRDRTRFRAAVLHLQPATAGTPTRVVPVTDDVAQPLDVGVRALAVQGRTLYVAGAFGLRAFWRRGARGAPDEAWEPQALGAPGVDLPPWTQLQFVHAGRDRLVHSGFAWKRPSAAWERWSGRTVERYGGTAAASLVDSTQPRTPPRPRPYLAMRDPGWHPAAEPSPEGFPAGPAVVRDAADTEDGVWLGTTLGLVRLDATTGAAVTFGPADGLPTPHVTTLRLCSGWLVASTIDGVFLLAPA